MTATVKVDTREALLDAAEVLFASSGPHGASLAAITKHAGQRNGGAIHYHFGGRDGLLAAVLDRHEAVLDEVRMNALIELRRSGSPSVESLVRVAVESLAGRLDSASGRSFLIIQRDRFIESAGLWEFRSASMRLLAAEAQAIIGDRIAPDELAERMQLVIQLVIHRLADRSRHETAGTSTPRSLVIETLVSAAAAVLGAGLVENR